MDEKFPDYLSHYYLSDRKPFLSLSDLEQNELEKKLADLRKKTESGESKRWFADWYVEERKKTELFLRNEFIKKGGKPKRRFPVYFVLGTSSIFNGLSKNGKEIKIKLSEIQPEHLSFTYPDSMATMILENDVKYKKEYHGKIFTPSEIIEVVNKHGMPKDEIAYNSKFGYPNYIEAQFWGDEFVLKAD